MKKTLIILIVLVLGYLGVQYIFNNFNSNNISQNFVENSKDVITEKAKSLEDEVKEKTKDLKESTKAQKIKRNPIDSICIGEFCDGSGSGDNYLAEGNSFMIPVYGEHKGSGEVVGCGMELVYLPHYTQPKTAGIMNEAYRKLFSLGHDNGDIQNYLSNPVASYPYIHFKEAALENGVAKVYLEGSLDYGPGHCSVPALEHQIPALAFQFDTVNSIEVYVNGEIFDSCKFDESEGEGSCPEEPQLWIAQK